MKKRTKGLLAFAFLGGIMLTSTIVIAIPGIAPDGMSSDPMMSNMPRDTPHDVNYDYSQNHAEADRAMFCGTGQPPESTDYIREFEIPTACTNPLAIAVDYDGNPWFAESNTGMVATFDPNTETFTEYPNRNWPTGTTSMMWGMDYAPDGSIWYTDDWSDSLWIFNPLVGQYASIPYPKAVEDPLPQRLLIDGSQIIVNDFYANMITFLDISQPEFYLVAPSPLDNSVTASFAPDGNGNIWYTSWQYPDGNGYLVKFEHDRYIDIATTSGQQFLPPIDFVDLYELPAELETPNGIAVSPTGNVWLADTSSSSLFEFLPSFEYFTKYVTADPLPSTYGNYTGVIKQPISRPYWLATDDAGRIVFNAQTSNNISVLDPTSQKLVEYHVPSKNPYWSDCNVSAFNDTVLPAERCGVAQVFDFDVYQDQIWFTEWAENKIGVVDTAYPLPFDIELSSEFLPLARSAIEHVQFNVIANNDTALDANTPVQFEPYVISASEHVTATFIPEFDNSILNGQGASDPRVTNYNVIISVSDDAPGGLYKILFGAQAPDVAVGKFFTVTVQ